MIGHKKIKENLNQYIQIMPEIFGVKSFLHALHLFCENVQYSWGFYCTNNYEQAVRWANRGAEEPVVNYYSCERNNNLSYVCSLIEYIARQTKNRRRAVVEALGENGVRSNYTDFQTDVYYQNPSYLECSYKAGYLLD